MEYRTLGNTGIRVSRLCFGTLTMGPLQRALPPRQGADLLRAAYDMGVDFLDTAQIYGNYEHIALALADCPGMQVATKAYCYDEATARQALDEALLALKRERIEVFLLHEQESVHTLRGHEEALVYLQKRRQMGDVGAVGISTHHIAAVRAALKFPQVQVIHPLLNMRGLGIADGTAEEMEQAAAEAHGRGIGIYAMKVLGGGHLIPQREQAVSYAFEKPYIDSIAMGMQSLEEVHANCRRANGEPADPEILERLNAMPRTLLVHDWCDGCGRCAKRCGQGAMRIQNGKAHVDARKCVLCGYCAGVCPQFCIKVV